MTKYKSLPVIVDAFKIIDVGFTMKDDGVPLQIENGEMVIATKEMLARITPVKGDYWVINADGYIYLNPKDVFERKYKELKVIE